MTAYVFPGDPRAARACRDELDELRPDLVEAIHRATDGADPFVRPPGEMRSALVALVAVSLARWSRLVRPQLNTVLLGHGAGEISALAAGGALSEADALILAAARGQLIDELALRPGRELLAILGAGNRAVRDLASAHGLEVASDNAPGRIVLEGASARVEAALRSARERGLHAVPLAAGADDFLSCAIASRRREWEAVLQGLTMRCPRLPVFSCVSAQLIVEPRAVLVMSLTAPVRFRQALAAIERLGVRRFLDVGPGHSVAGLVRRTLPRAVVTALDIDQAAARGGGP
jgi:[acyl-carrier-protein] S-malonyltransferase